MAAINDEVYARMQEKAKERQLLEQEVNAIDTAREKLNSHTSLGGFTGASATFFIGKRKNFKPLQLLALAGVGFLMGSQVGYISGALAGINTIKALPDPHRLFNVIREVQEWKRQTSYSHQKTDPALHGEYTSTGAEFQTDRADQHQQQNGWQTNSNQQHQQPSSAASLQAQQQPTQPCKWEQIRSENLPNSAWTKVRQEAAEQKTDAKTINQAKAQRIDVLKERQVNFDDLPRTREEAGQRTRGRRNQWGDMTE